MKTKSKNFLDMLLTFLIGLLLMYFVLNQFDREYKRRCLDVWGAGKCVELMQDLLKGSK